MKRVAVTALIPTAVIAVLVWRIGSIYVDSSRPAGLRIIVSDMHVYRGSDSNLVTVTLDNPETKVRGIQLELCDADNYLSCTSCEVDDRIGGFTCASNEKANGCYELLLFSFTGVIEAGSGPLVRFRCDAAEGAPPDECRALSIGRLEIADEQKQSLEAAVKTGKVCFKDCTKVADCENALWCYASHSCVDGVCRHIPRCRDDGLYCNGREYCDEAGRECRRSPEPCAHCYDAGCRCDEERDRCTPYGESQGDRI